MANPEPDDAGTDHDVPVDLVELHEVLEMGLAEKAEAEAGDG